MPFSIRPSRRISVCCPVTYHCGDFEGHGTMLECTVIEQANASKHGGNRDGVEGAGGRVAGVVREEKTRGLRTKLQFVCA